jgi:hypothetical protein
MHADCELLLLENGIEQDDILGENWYPAERMIEFEALINIRRRLGNRNILLQNEEIRQEVEAITRQILWVLCALQNKEKRKISSRFPTGAPGRFGR